MAVEDYEMTIGIECHVQLATKTKLFSPADNDARNAAPNTKVHAIDFALPGMLPRLNKEAIRLAVRAGKALNAEIAHESRFDRKHYFYPDLPKGYQTTQMYQPIIGSGVMTVPLEDGSEVNVRIHHAHLEEDAGKLSHSSDGSLVDLNRAGTPLIEVVSEPDMHSAAQARAFATELYRRMTYAGVTHGDLYHGNMRFDVNISIAPKGSDTLGQRAEIKNLNSFRSVERAAEYEFKRQAALLDAGELVVQETRGWNDDTQTTFSQRSKENAHDYRYMPDPDIPPVILTDDQIIQWQSDVPRLPAEYRESWKSLRVDKSVINTLLGTQSHAQAVWYVQSNVGDAHAERVANWFASVVSGEDFMNDELQDINGDALIELSKMYENKEVSSTAAKQIFAHICVHPNVSPQEYAKEQGLIQNSDTSAIEAIVERVLADEASQKAIADIRSGNDKAIGYLVGQVMKQSKGQANPAMAKDIIAKKL